MKRKSPPTEISATLPAEKEAKIEISDEKIDHALSQQWLQAALLAFEEKEFKPLLALLNSPEINLAVIDWNKAPQKGPFQGVTLAYLATELAFHNYNYNNPLDLSSAAPVADQYRLLQTLINSPRKNLQCLDWNAHPLQENKNLDSGITLAWRAIEIYRQDSIKVLLDILEDLPPTLLQTINWNAHPQRGDDRRATFACLVLDTNYDYGSGEKVPQKLMNFINFAPKSFIQTLDWNACYSERSMIWLAAVDALGGSNELLNQFLDTSTTIQNWNSAPKDSGIDEGMYGATLAYLAIKLKMQNADSRLYKKLIASFQLSHGHIDWNASRNDKELTASVEELIEDYGVKLVWKAVELSLSPDLDLDLENSALLKKLLAEPVEVLKTINWNESYPSRLKQHALSQHSPMLDRVEETDMIRNIRVDLFTFLIFQIPKCGISQKLSHEDFKNLLHPEILATLNLNWSYLLDSAIANKLAWRAFEIFYSGGDPRLLKNLLTQKPDALEKINWNSIHKRPNLLYSWEDKRDIYLMNDDSKPYFIMSRKERELLIDSIDFHLFSAVISLVPLKMDPQFLQNLLQPRILATLSWSKEPLRKNFACLINQALLPVEEALSQLPILWLNNLLQNLSILLNDISNQYLNLLVSIKETGEFDSSPSLTAFVDTYPSKLLTAYQGIPPSQLFYNKAQFELANRYLTFPEITSIDEQKRQDVLSQAFYHACQWYHYSPEEKPGENQDFIFRLVTQMFSKPEGILEKPPLKWPEKTKTFLEKIALGSNPELLNSSIRLFMKSVQNGKLEIEVMNLKQKLNESSTASWQPH